MQTTTKYGLPYMVAADKLAQLPALTKSLASTIETLIAGDTLKGAKGDTGAAGPNTVPTDEAIATAVKLSTSDTRTALASVMGTEIAKSASAANTAVKSAAALTESSTTITLDEGFSGTVTLERYGKLRILQINTTTGTYAVGGTTIATGAIPADDRPAGNRFAACYFVSSYGGIALAQSNGNIQVHNRNSAAQTSVQSTVYWKIA